MRRFNYSDSVKKMQVKWCQLKAYDQQHGNILQHRTQVMLKGKHRDLKDQEAHWERATATG
ncbi:hypothetical protein BGZ65_006825 [Modicella reniformis]|uniref:Uncharacterized protein n=1 Tax=Modicella reniformis TaxID=1440133 RepID=A0A9P6IJ97_9FUNG|nr:hypothetical protein BGZ65_006825 [Modicella reniformis]